GIGFAVFARVRADQPDRRRALRGHQSDDPLLMTAAVAPAALATEVRTPWTELWRKDRTQHVAVVAGWFVALLVVVAILAPWIVPYDAENFFDYDSLNA